MERIPEPELMDDPAQALAYAATDFSRSDRAMVADLLDRYQGAQVAAGSCSQAFRLRYRDAKRTLTEAEVEQAHQAVRTALESQFQAQLRS